MDSNFDYTETIENYIRGEMSGDQRVQFENQLSQDPLLREELQIQEDLIHSIKEVRRVELKNRLDGVQVGIFDGITSTTGYKVLATTLITAVIGVGSYYAFFNSGQEPVEEAAQEQVAETQTPEVGEIVEKGKKDSKADSKEKAKESDTSAKQTEEKETEPASENAKEEAAVTTTESKAQKPASKQETTSDQEKEEQTVDFNPVIPDLDDNFAEEDSTPANDIEVPDNELGPSVVETKTTFEIETKSDTKNQFHYRFKSGKLILFGDFSGSTYEIIELNSTAGKSYYLYYNSNFYPLSVDNTKITELRVLTDKTLIDELKKIKGDN